MTRRSRQELSRHFKSVRKKFLSNLMEKSNFAKTRKRGTKHVCYQWWNRKCFGAQAKSTVNQKGDKAIFIFCTGIDTGRLTAYLTVARVETKLHLFLILNGESYGRTERILRNDFPVNLFVWYQSKGWMHERSTKSWIQQVWAPYVANYGHFVLLLDHFASLKSGAVIEIFKIMKLVLIRFQKCISGC